ncbi:MAG: hypothetical protein JWR34_327 [Mycobacterium sp.]|nr:hypothetical protein [Mycobacterium sp.]
MGTLASRLDMTFGELLLTIGSSVDGVDLRRLGISVYLTDPELAAVTASTGLEAADIQQMTLARYDGYLVSIDMSTKHLRWSTWNPGRSRFCPACLRASSGRWQLRWRLPWVFVCDVHGCLLEDACPECGQAQRVSPRWLPAQRIPDLQRCSLWTHGATTRVPCAGDLTTSAGTVLAEEDPLAVAHARLSTVLDGAATTFGIYALSPASDLQVLADLRVLSARMLASIDAEDVDDILAPNKGTSIAARLIALDLNLRQWGKPGVFTARAPALITAVGIALALTVLGSESIHEAGGCLRRVIGQRGAPNRTATPGDLRPGHLSPALEAVHLSAISEHFNPSNKLRFRTMTAFPKYPGPEGSADCGVAVQSVPTALWRDWSLRLGARQRFPDLVSCSLSALLLIVGTRMPMADARRQLGAAVTSSQQVIVLNAIHRNPLWPSVSSAIVRLAENLTAHPSPIDYQRRRELRYEALLPLEVWTDICEWADLGRVEASRSGQLARSWLFARISGQPADMSPCASGLDCAASRRDDLVERFTPAVISALDEEATRFLHDHDILDEPVSWSPPLTIVGDLELPGPDPTTVSISELHRVLDVKAMTMAAAARHFGVPTAVVRFRLEQFPIERPVVRCRPVVGCASQIERLRTRLTPEDLADLHHRDGLSIGAIATRCGVHRATVRKLAREYGIETRAARLNIDPAWFRHEYVENHRTLTAIANDIGVSISCVSRFATRQGIPIVRDPRVLRRPTTTAKSTTDGPKTPPHRRPSAIDPDWLRREYVLKRRSAAELANELGVATSTVHRQVKKHEFYVSPPSKPKKVPPSKQKKVRPRAKPKEQPVVRQLPDVDPEWLRAEYDWLRTEHQDRQRTLTDIARDIGTSVNEVSRLAKRHGLAVRRGRPRLPGRVHAETVQRRQKVSLDWLHREFVVNERPFAELAREIGVTASTLRRQARQHHIGDTERRNHNQTSIDLDWLHREYVINNRSLDDMAREIGMATSSLRRQAVKHDIGTSKRERHRCAIDADWFYQQYVVKQRTLTELARERDLSYRELRKHAAERGIAVRLGRPNVGLPSGEGFPDDTRC